VRDHFAVVAERVDQTERHSHIEGGLERLEQQLESTLMKGIVIVQKVKEPSPRAPNAVVAYERWTASRWRFPLDVRNPSVGYGCHMVSGRAFGRIVEDDDLNAGMLLGKRAFYRADNEFLAPMSRNDDGYVGIHQVRRTIPGRGGAANELRRHIRLSLSIFG